LSFCISRKKSKINPYMYIKVNLKQGHYIMTKYDPAHYIMTKYDPAKKKK